MPLCLWPIYITLIRVSNIFFFFDKFSLSCLFCSQDWICYSCDQSAPKTKMCDSVIYPQIIHQNCNFWIYRAWGFSNRVNFLYPELQKCIHLFTFLSDNNYVVGKQVLHSIYLFFISSNLIKGVSFLNIGRPQWRI